MTLQRNLTRIRTMKWLFVLTTILVIIGLKYVQSQDTQTVIDARNAVFSATPTYQTAQTVSVSAPVGPFLRDCDGDGILEADTDGNSACSGDPEVKDYNADSTRELPNGTPFTGNFEFTCFFIPSDVAIVASGPLTIKALNEVAIFGSMRLGGATQFSTPGKIDLRTSAWMLAAVEGPLTFTTALTGGVDESQTPYLNEDGTPSSVPPIDYTSACAGNCDVSVTKTDAPDPVIVGSNVTYTITVRNNGSDAATGVVMTDTLPSGVALGNVQTTQGTCAQVNGGVRCDLGSLSVGGPLPTQRVLAKGRAVRKQSIPSTATVTIVVTPNAAGQLSNTATVVTNQLDPNTGNNSATATTTVNPATAPDLAGSWSGVGQSKGPRAIFYGGAVGGFQYTLNGKFKLQNRGNADAPASTVRFYLSDNAIFDEGDTLLTEVVSNAIPAGKSQSIALNVPLPNGANGYVIAIVDAGDAVTESNEANNVSAHRLSEQSAQAAKKPTKKKKR